MLTKTFSDDDFVLQSERDNLSSYCPSSYRFGCSCHSIIPETGPQYTLRIEGWPLSQTRAWAALPEKQLQGIQIGVQTADLPPRDSCHGLPASGLSAGLQRGSVGAVSAHASGQKSRSEWALD